MAYLHGGSGTNAIPEAGEVEVGAEGQGKAQG